MRSAGISCAAPPPVPPPFIPRHGPSDGSRSARHAHSPRRVSASARPILVVVLPSPAGVGVIAETSTSRAAPWRVRARVSTPRSSFAASGPHGTRSAAESPSLAPASKREWLGGIGGYSSTGSGTEGLPIPVRECDLGEGPPSQSPGKAAFWLAQSNQRCGDNSFRDRKKPPHAFFLRAKKRRERCAESLLACLQQEVLHRGID